MKSLITPVILSVFLFFVYVNAVHENNAGRILKFLQSIPTTARAEMEAILQNSTLTKGQVEQKLDEWAKKQPGDFPDQYQNVKGLLNAGSNAGPNATPTKVSSTAEQAIAEIRQNKSITRTQERLAILDILSKEPNDQDDTFVLPNHLNT